MRSRYGAFRTKMRWSQVRWRKPFRPRAQEQLGLKHLAKFPWIGQTPELISGKHCRAIGKARLLLDFFTHHQTDPKGRVNYGKPITYAWIRSRIPDCCG